MPSIQIADRIIGPGHPAFIIAELSANHNGDLQTAIDTIRWAKQTGADAIKLQTYRPDTITIDCDNEYFQVNHGTIWDGTTLFKLYETAFTPWEWHEELFRVAKEEGLICFSSPFDPTAVDLLEDLDAPAYKIASFEILDIPLIEYVASKGKPVIISTGIARPEDIELAVQTCRDAGNDQIALLKCTSSYPAPIELANLNTIPDLMQRYGVVSGLSDHTMGTVSPVVATTLGGSIIEKHFILDKSIGGPDASFSLDVAEFSQLVTDVRDAEKALGKVSYELSEKQLNSRQLGGRSLFAVEDIAAGQELTKENIRSIRPGHGLPPKHFKELMGRTAKTAISRGTPLAWELLA